MDWDRKISSNLLNRRYLIEIVHLLANLSLQLGQRIVIVSHLGEHHSLLVVVLAKNFIVINVQIEFIADAEPGKKATSLSQFHYSKKSVGFTCDYIPGTRNIPSGKRWRRLA